MERASLGRPPAASGATHFPPRGARELSPCRTISSSSSRHLPEPATGDARRPALPGSWVIGSRNGSFPRLPGLPGRSPHYFYTA
eukprot:scaffold296663_cov39-Tisochrysis_lutea.AAC.1